MGDERSEKLKKKRKEQGGEVIERIATVGNLYHCRPRETRGRGRFLVPRDCGYPGNYNI